MQVSLSGRNFGGNRLRPEGKTADNFSQFASSKLHPSAKGFLNLKMLNASDAGCAGDTKVEAAGEAKSGLGQRCRSVSTLIDK